ncbi:hypothetical protein ACWT_6682 [Actinoplanes sp. SE50]|uniref:DUF6194 family protein n=1 Tax=unclassified Actinoplanes TaxID=2626549 RepID=UPI00023ECA44|nr:MULTISPECIES: DUF6194 family protein [unclassified Actinoplanes]AEV87694.1 hypothetical protein ACPL_6812 [Actinoplanes sp. SE50/110]ATO86097.1 hypothetical protein ACWT_6682 [Actinoplanes sp. SE50]SLM03511.1 hypothetical protein ACSP50_6804 [Actinoplanes sp. SE50/110]
MELDELAARICRLPEVVQLIAGPGTGAPELSWGDRFFFVGEDRMRPFATIVVRDVPGFDECSGLDRPGVFRLNLELGRSRFGDLFGFGPEEFAARRSGIDFATPDRWFPHPVYAVQSWASVVNPVTVDVDSLIGHARGRRR